MALSLRAASLLANPHTQTRTKSTSECVQPFSADRCHSVILSPFFNCCQLVVAKWTMAPSQSIAARGTAEKNLNQRVIIIMRTHLSVVVTLR